MKPGKLPTLYLTRSSQTLETFTFTYQQPADDSGDPVDLMLDLSQYDDIRMDVRNTDNFEGDLLYSLSLGDGVSITGDDNEQLNLEHSTAKTDNFEADGEYWRDLMLVTGDEAVIVARGKMIVQFNITEKP